MRLAPHVGNEQAPADRVPVLLAEIQRDEAMQSTVLGFVDHTHTASAELLDDAVVGDGLTEQKGEALRPRANMLGVREGQVNGTREIGVFGFRSSKISATGPELVRNPPLSTDLDRAAFQSVCCGRTRIGRERFVAKNCC
jgi:hypothetical protein